MQNVSEEQIYEALLRAEKIDPFVASIIRRMAQEMRDLRDQQSAAMFIQGIGG